jgi:C-terminal processing protease CtpA/Prc
LSSYRVERTSDRPPIYHLPAAAAERSTSSHINLNESSAAATALPAEFSTLKDVIYRVVDPQLGHDATGLSVDPDSNKITEITAESPASYADLAVGDRIVSVNEIDVRNISGSRLIQILRENEADILILGLIRAACAPNRNFFI